MRFSDDGQVLELLTYMTDLRLAATTRLSACLISMRRHHKVGLMLAADVVSLPVCFMLAMLLRIGDPDIVVRHGLILPVLIALLTIPILAITGLYGAVIRFIDLSLLSMAGIGLAIVLVLTQLLLSYVNYSGAPKNVFVIYWFIAFSYIVASRLMARTLLRNDYARRVRESESRVAIYGAGEAGVKLLRAMRLNGKYSPVCFFDDKVALDNRNVAGMKVFHSSRLVQVVRQKNIELIVVAVPSATQSQRSELMSKAYSACGSVKILCSLMALADREISTSSIREIKIDDLLGRAPIAPDHHLFSRCAHQKNVLVTGAGGSIGSELCRQIMTLSPSELHLLEHSEYALYKIEEELRTKFPRLVFKPHLGSVCDSGLVDRIMRECRIDTIYHAAAYKHVPLVESNMAEGIRNNIRGAQVVADAAEKYKVQSCVLISSDKAVRPTSIMGASKRIAELIFQAKAVTASQNTKFCMVRFGNVLGSSGSVVPLFQKQLEDGGPITITHPEITRYFMSIPEAVQLVMQAGAMATGGDIFVMDMGEPVKIIDLARTMIAMCGLTEKSEENPDGNIAFRFVGLRPGEKLYEELFSEAGATSSVHPRIMRTAEHAVDPVLLSEQIALLLAACDANDKATIQFFVKKMVRGYTPSVPVEEARVRPSATQEELATPMEHQLLTGLRRTI